MSNLLRDEAILYARRGWYVLPLRHRSKEPDGVLVPRGYHQATTFYDQIFEWWERAPSNNVGIACAQSGLVVIDYDPRNGAGALENAEIKYGRLPITPTSKTGSGGEHRLFRRPLGVTFKKQLCDGVDIKCNGYIVAPPSRTISTYAWGLDRADPENGNVAELPEGWLEACRTNGEDKGTWKGQWDDGAEDPLRKIPAAVFIRELTGRNASEQGWVQCPFHKAGKERTPSLLCKGGLWCCYACDPPPGKSALGGNIFDFAGLLMGYSAPLKARDYYRVRESLEKTLGKLAPQKS